MMMIHNDTYLQQDDDINGDGMNGGDEDDHDPAEVVVEPFDLALLIKVLAASQDDQPLNQVTM